MSIWLYFPSVRGTSILSSLKLQIIEHWTLYHIVYRDPWLPPAPPRTGWPPASGGRWQCADQQHGRLTTAEPNFLKYHISNKIKIKIKYKGELAQRNYTRNPNITPSKFQLMQYKRGKQKIKYDEKWVTVQQYRIALSSSYWMQLKWEEVKLKIQRIKEFSSLMFGLLKSL